MSHNATKPDVDPDVNQPTQLKQLEITEVALVPAGANQSAHIVLFKAKKEGAMPATATATATDKEKIIALEKAAKDASEKQVAVQKTLDDAAALALAQADEIAKLKAAAPALAPTSESVSKDATDEVKAYVKKMDDALAKAADVEKQNRARIDALEKAGKEAGIRAGLNEHAAAIDIDAVTKALMVADEDGAKAINDLVAKLAASNAVVLASSSVTQPAENDSYTKAETLAKALRDSDPTLSDTQAMSKVWQNNPDLYASAIKN